jgi:hypothetical protein
MMGPAMDVSRVIVATDFDPRSTRLGSGRRTYHERKRVLQRSGALQVPFTGNPLVETALARFEAPLLRDADHPRRRRS